MNEMKPEDVMRALEHCANIDDCEGCVLLRKGGCIRELTRNALALLRENDAEIERLKALKKIATDNNHQCYGLGYEDGIKDFAEKIKTFYHNLSGKTVGGSVEYHIDQIAKEMKEDQG